MSETTSLYSQIRFYSVQLLPALIVPVWMLAKAGDTDYLIQVGYAFLLSYVPLFVIRFIFLKNEYQSNRLRRARIQGDFLAALLQWSWLIFLLPGSFPLWLVSLLLLVAFLAGEPLRNPSRPFFAPIHVLMILLVGLISLESLFQWKAGCEEGIALNCSLLLTNPYPYIVSAVIYTLINPSRLGNILIVAAVASASALVSTNVEDFFVSGGAASLLLFFPGRSDGSLRSTVILAGLVALALGLWFYFAGDFHFFAWSRQESGMGASHQRWALMVLLVMADLAINGLRYLDGHFRTFGDHWI